MGKETPNYLFLTIFRENYTTIEFPSRQNANFYCALSLLHPPASCSLIHTHTHIPDEISGKTK